jgi:hypothetical protein
MVGRLVHHSCDCISNTASMAVPDWAQYWYYRPVVASCQSCARIAGWVVAETATSRAMVWHTVLLLLFTVIALPSGKAKSCCVGQTCKLTHLHRSLASKLYDKRWFVLFIDSNVST